MPVNPVWPNDPTGSSSPRFDENASRCPSPSAAHVAVAARRRRAASSSRPSAATGCARRCRRRRRAACGRRSTRSAAVLNSPACPATPPIRRAVGSCTTPRSIGCPAHRTASRAACTSRSARSAAASDAGGRNIVSLMPSGSKIRVCANSSSGSPLTRRDDVAEQEEVDVAVDEALARRRVGTSSIASPIAVSYPLHVVAEIEIGPQARRVRQQVADRDVAPCRSARSPGMNVATRSVSRIRPSSTSFITLVVVATTLVSDARSKIVSSVIGSADGHERAVADRLLVQHAIARGRRGRRRRAASCSAIACSTSGSIASSASSVDGGSGRPALSGRAGAAGQRDQDAQPVASGRRLWIAAAGSRVRALDSRSRIAAAVR